MLPATWKPSTLETVASRDYDADRPRSSWLRVPVPCWRSRASVVASTRRCCSTVSPSPCSSPRGALDASLPRRRRSARRQRLRRSGGAGGGDGVGPVRLGPVPLQLGPADAAPPCWARTYSTGWRGHGRRRAPAADVTLSPALPGPSAGSIFGDDRDPQWTTPRGLATAPAEDPRLERFYSTDLAPRPDLTGRQGAAVARSRARAATSGSICRPKPAFAVARAISTGRCAPAAAPACRSGSSSSASARPQLPPGARA